MRDALPTAPEDLDAIVASCLEKDPYDRLESVAADLTVLFGGYRDGALFGTVQLGLDVPPNQPHRADVKKLLVHRRARGMGLGAALMVALETEARRRKLGLLTLDTASPEADRLYRRLGYTETGVIGRPSLASADKGRAFLDSLARSFKDHLALLS